MKKISVIGLVVVGLLFAAHAEAAKPKHHRTRNANRIGPYAGALVGMTQYPGDRSVAEGDLRDTFNDVPTRNLVVGTKDKNLGYAAMFGYRFNRFIAMEFAL